MPPRNYGENINMVSGAFADKMDTGLYNLKLTYMRNLVNVGIGFRASELW